MLHVVIFFHWQFVTYSNNIIIFQQSTKMAKYVCTFDEATLKVAIEELSEEPDQRESQVETFRQWIRQQNHLNCPTDTGFLLKFLRTAKFSQLRARKVLEGYLNQKTINAHYLADIDMSSPEIQRILETKLILPLPERDAKGRRIFFFNYGALDADPKIWDRDMVLKTFYGIYYFLSMTESDLVNGIILVFDHSQFTLKWLSFWGIDTLPKLLKTWQGNFPGRFKGYHYYNPGKLFEAFMSVIRPVLTQKFKDRIYLHDTLESLYKVIPMKHLPVEYLPDDYTGPNAGTMQEICDKFLEELKTAEARDYILNFTSSKWKSNKALKEDDIPNESFRKLNVE